MEGGLNLGLNLKIIKNVFGIIGLLQICYKDNINFNFLNNQYISSILQRGLILMPILQIRKKLSDELRKFFT
jgi:hypothetical protein